MSAGLGTVRRARLFLPASPTPASSAACSGDAGAGLTIIKGAPLTGGTIFPFAAHPGNDPLQPRRASASMPQRGRST